MSESKGDGRHDRFAIREYRAPDREAFLSLYETVWGTRKRRDWFDWRFLDNPRADGVEMIVAEGEDGLVGVEPLLPYRIRAGDRLLDAYQPVDWIVHPEHRRQGIFTAMTERLLAYASDRASLLFNFPNEELLPGLRNFDWMEVGTVAARYRVQDAGALAAIRRSSPSPTARAVATLSSPLVRGGLGVADRIGSSAPDVEVERVDGVPVPIVHELYAANRPDRLHIPRDVPHLEWRFANPRWDVRTYVARRNGEPVASVIAAAETVSGSLLVRILDVQPVAGADGASGSRGDPDAVDAIVRRIVADYGDTSVLKAPGEIYADVFRRHGFLRDDAVPLSRVATPTRQAVRPLADEECGRTAARSNRVVTGGGGSDDVGSAADWFLAIGDLDVA